MTVTNGRGFESCYHERRRGEKVAQVHRLLFPPTAEKRAGMMGDDYDPAPVSSTVTARRFWDQHEMSLHTATGRSLP